MNKLVSGIKYKVVMAALKKSIKKRPENLKTPDGGKSFYDFQLTSIEGKPFDFSTLKGKKVLIVNIASECGFTPQYEELEELYKKYNGKLEIIGFPADNFGGQEPGENQEIATFCQRNFGLSFQLFEKSSVKKGADQNPLYQWLSSEDQNGWNSSAPKWNFTKYLVNESGDLIGFYNSSVKPTDPEIVNEL